MTGKTTKRKKVIFNLLIACLVLLLITAVGCWDRNEPEDSSFIIGMGFDYDEESDMYKIVVQVADPAAVEEAGGEGGGGEGDPVKVTSAKGQTPFDAVRALTLHISREPFFAHNKLIVVTEDMARKGLGPVYDYLSRERQSRLIALPMILKGDESITNLFRTELPLEQFMTEGLEREIQLSAVERAVFPSRSLIEVLNVGEMEGREPIIGTVELGEQEEEDLLGEEGAVRSTIHVVGGGLMKGDELQGFFEEKEVKGWYWIRGMVTRATMVFECPLHDLPMSVEVFDSDSNMEIWFDEDDEPVIELEVFANGRIQQQDCPTVHAREGEIVESLNRRLATVIENEINSAVEKAQELEVDALGFGNLIYRKEHERWKELEEDWPGSFSELTVKVDVDANIRRGGLIQMPPGREHE